MRIDLDTPLWIVAAPTGPDQKPPDLVTKTTFGAMPMHLAACGSSNPAVFTAKDEAEEEARQRLLVWRVASQVRIDRRLPPGSRIQVTLRDQDGSVLFDGEVQAW